MKKNIQLFIIFLLTFCSFINLKAQSIPSGFNYQAVVRNAEGTLIRNRFVEVKFTIFNADGDVFNDKYPINTNEFGLINLIVGADSDDYNSIDWSNGNYSLKVELNQGSGFEELGISSIQAVPFAALAKDVINKDDADADPSNEIQTLSFDSENNELSISNGNSIIIPVGGQDADSDPLNEIQIISKSNDSIFLSENGGFVIDEVDDADADPSNEIQTLSFNSENNELSISNGNSIIIPVGGQDADADPLNEIQIISKSNDSIFLSENGGFVVDQVDDADADSTNELQLLSINENEISISNGNTIKLPDNQNLWEENGSDISRKYGVVFIGDGIKLGKLSILNDEEQHGIYCDSRTIGNSIYGINRKSTGNCVGGNFISYSNEGVGVIGASLSLSGETFGGYFSTNSSIGVGLMGIANSKSGKNYGVYGSTNSNEGYAGYFDGRVKIKGELKLGDVLDSSQKGSIRWNEETQDFEGFNGVEWKSFTSSKSSTWGNIFANESFSIPNLIGHEEDYFGSSISGDDDFIAIGAYGTKVGENEDQGIVRMYKRYKTSWYQDTEITGTDGEKGDRFGFSVAVDGEYAVVGAPGKKVGPNLNQGKAYVFQRIDHEWIQKAELIAFDGLRNSGFGISVSMEGEYIVIGAANMDVDFVKQGKVYIYHREGNDWLLQSDVVAPDAEKDDYFGISVSISGDNVAIGASGRNVNENIDQGKAYVFKRNGTFWAYYTDLELQYGQKLGLFGSSISIDNNTIVIGCPHYVRSGYLNKAGAVYIYAKGGSTWYLKKNVYAYDAGKDDNFGKSVSVKGDYILVGASGKTIGNTENQGKAYLFKRIGGEWHQEFDFIASDGEEDDNFGFSCSLSNKVAFVGAPGKTIRNKKYIGKAYIYSR